MECRRKKTCIGKSWGNEMNGGLERGEAGLDGMRQQQWLAQNGLEASAEVLSISDTGILFNMDLVVSLTVKIQPAMIAMAFETTGKTILPKTAIPRIGDRIKVKYNPVNPTQFVVLPKNDP